MGTRSLVKFFDAKDKPFFCVYRQYDGHPEGAGMEYKEFLDSFNIVNGYSDVVKRQANGIQCLAAQFIAHFKTGIGNFYIYHPDFEDVGEEYLYEVREANGKAEIKCFEIGISITEIPILKG